MPAGPNSSETSARPVPTTNSLLRRNIHRLEKGLLARPRRAVFGLGYIAETLDKFEAQASERISGSGQDSDEFEWFANVLTQYFEVAGPHPRLDELRARFGRIMQGLPQDSSAPRRVPFAEAGRRHTHISYEEFRSLCEERKSVRWFLDEPVPRELIHKALDVARFAPSACNRYPFFFHVFDDREKVELVASLPGGTVGFAHNFPVVIAIIGELRNFYGERDRHLIYVDASLAAMSVVLAAETLGLATCCINWPDIEEAERRAEQVLQLEPDQRPVMFMAMGYPGSRGHGGLLAKETPGGDRPLQCRAGRRALKAWRRERAQSCTPNPS